MSKINEAAEKNTGLSVIIDEIKMINIKNYIAEKGYKNDYK